MSPLSGDKLPLFQDVAADVAPELARIGRLDEYVGALDARIGDIVDEAKVRADAVLAAAGPELDAVRGKMEESGDKFWEATPLFTRDGAAASSPSFFAATHFRGTLYHRLADIRQSAERVLWMGVSLFAAQNSEGKLLVTRRASKDGVNGMLQMPGGHAGVGRRKPGSPRADVSPVGTAWREAMEEVAPMLPAHCVTGADLAGRIRFHQEGPEGKAGRGTFVSFFRAVIPPLVDIRISASEHLEPRWLAPEKLLESLEDAFSGRSRDFFIPHHAYGYLMVLEEFCADRCGPTPQVGLARIKAAQKLLMDSGKMARREVVG